MTRTSTLSSSACKLSISVSRLGMGSTSPAGISFFSDRE